MTTFGPKTVDPQQQNTLIYNGFLLAFFTRK